MHDFLSLPSIRAARSFLAKRANCVLNPRYSVVTPEIQICRTMGNRRGGLSIGDDSDWTSPGKGSFFLIIKVHA
jgi:hypothetical protein